MQPNGDGLPVFLPRPIAFLPVALRGIPRKRSGWDLFVGSSQVTFGTFGFEQSLRMTEKERPPFEGLTRRTGTPEIA